jgi:PPM family protein phosphatase
MPVVESSGLSHAGPVREDNQDSIHLSDGLCDPEESRLYVVADGMGGYSHGAVASSLAIEKLVEGLEDGKTKMSPGNFQRGVERANLSVYKKAQQLGAGRMGTTLTAVLITGQDLHLIHVGDCRAYLVRDGRSICLTADHTTVGDLVRAKLIPPEKVRTHSQRSILTRAIGIGLFVRPDISRLRLQQGDYLIICSDGVWSVIQDDEFAEIVQNSLGIDQVSQDLLNLALQRETDDNVSVVAVHIRELRPAAGTSQDWVKERRPFRWMKR